MGYYPHFILPVRSSRGFASTAPDLFALFGLAFASAAHQRCLTLPVTVSRRIIMQKARGHPFRLPGVGLPPLVGVWFQVHCPPLAGFFPSFARATGFAIGRQGVLSRGRWASRVQTHFHVLSPTQGPDRTCSPLAYGTVTRCGGTFQIASARVLKS